MKPILIVLVGVFFCLVIFSTMSIQVVLMVQRNWSKPVGQPTFAQPPKWDSKRVCIATKDFVQALVKDLKREKATCVVDWGSSIGEVSLPLVKSGFSVFSIGSFDLTRMRSKLLPTFQERWKFSLDRRIGECILLNHNSMEVDQALPEGAKRVIKVC
jgi:hypothetical protein